MRWSFCPQDGMKIEDAWKYCPSCGIFIGCVAPQISINSPYIPPQTTGNCILGSITIDYNYSKLVYPPSDVEAYYGSSTQRYVDGKWANTPD